MPTTTLLSLVLSFAPQQEPAARAEVAPAVRATNELGLALYKALDGERPGENLFLSPFSIAVAMSMVTEGAREETLAELRQALHLDANTPLAELHAAFQALLARYREGGGNADSAMREHVVDLRTKLAAANAEAEKLASENKRELASQAESRARELAALVDLWLPKIDRYELRTANSLWVERTYPLVPAFVQTLDRCYGTGGVNRLDIAGNPEAARTRINGWVEENTERHIKDLIPRDGITRKTSLVIANAVFFRGQWTDPFGESTTREEDFLLAAGGRARAKLMHDRERGSIRYAAFTGDGRAFATPAEMPAEAAKQPAKYPGDDGFTMIELPYKGGELAMLVLAPRSPDGLPHLERLLTATSLASWTTALRQRTVDTAMLRFEQRGTFSLASALQAAGVRRAFKDPLQPGGAQFGGIAADPNPARAVFVSDVCHQAWLQVDEKGTEAAAATALVMNVTACVDNPTVPFIPVFRADRPFLFLIRDTNSGAILFLGRVTDPRT